MGDKFKFLTSMILKVTEVKGHSNKVVLGVLFVLLVLGGIYWLNVLDKEQYLTQRNFRLLNLWGQEITNKIDSLNTVSKLAFQELEGQREIAAVQEYSCNAISGNIKRQQLVSAKLCAAGLDNIKISKEQKSKERKANLPEFSISLNAESNKLLFKIEYQDFSKKYTSNLILQADLDLSEFIEELTNERNFQNVLLISKEKEVIFQKISKEYSWRNWNNIVHNTQEDTWFNFFENDARGKEKLSNKSNLDFSPQFFYFKAPHGEQFAVFTQPIHFYSKNMVKNETLYIAGIVSGEQFRQSYLSISSTALLVTMAVLLGFVVALPFIRLSMMGSTDPLKSFHICILLFAMSLGSGLLTILFLDIGFFETGKRIINDQMEKSAKNIKIQAQTELLQVLRTLKHFDSLENPESLREPEIPQVEKKLITWKKDVLLCNVSGSNGQLGNDCYPDYSLVYWMDDQGYLRENWTPVGFPGYVTPLPLIKRKYVSAVLNERKNLWHIEKPEKYNFFLEPIVSWSTGINRVVASMQSKRDKPELDQSHAAFGSIQVAALQFEFLSLMKNVVVSPGIGFVVVDDKDSKVLFHSSQQRALRENFLVETDDNQMLRDLIWAGEAGHAEGRYWGVDTHFYILPFDDVPWTLVVYRDREILGSASLVALVISGSLFTLWVLIIFGIPWFSGWVFRGSFYLKKYWLWPDQRYHTLYRTVTIFNCLLFLLGLWVFWVLGNASEWLLLACLIISLIALLACFYFFRNKKNNLDLDIVEESEPGFLKILNYPYSFSSMISSCLLIFSVLPAIGIMGAVYQKEMTIVVKHQLLKLHQELNDTAKPVVNFSQDQNFKKNGMLPLQNDGHEECLASDGKYGLLGFYPDFLLQSKWHLHCSSTKNLNVSDTLFDNFYQKISHYFVPLKKGVENWGLIVDETGNDYVQWTVEDSSVTLTGKFQTRIVDSYQPKYSLAKENDSWKNLTVSVSADLPIQALIFGDDWLKYQSLFTYILYAVLMSIWVSFIVKMPQITANNTLFLFRPRRSSSELPLELDRLSLVTTPNLIIVGYPGQGKTRQLQQIKNSTDSHNIYLNLRDVPDKNWISYVESQETRYSGGTSIPIVIIDQFEFRCNEPLINQKKLELLEWLLYVALKVHQENNVTKGKTFRHVHVISNTYPGVFPMSAEDSEQEVLDNQRGVLSVRWHVLWEAFGLVYYAMNDRESDQHRYNEWLSGELGGKNLDPKIWDKMSEDFLRPYYQVIWQSVTLDEQLALFNLARDQFIHVKHPGLNSLLCKGLIHFAPHLCLMDDRFGSFVKYAGKRDQLEQFAKSHKEGNWSIIKVPLGVTFIVFFAFLAITQEEFRSIFPALITILPVLFQGMPDFTQILKGSDKN